MDKKLWKENCINPQWCAGCGIFMELTVLETALTELEIEPHMATIIGGIGCAGQMPQYLNGYSLKMPHGRILPTMLGVKLARPDLTVVGQGGDGDAFAIGAGHFVNFPGFNVDVTYIVTDNEVYGLTKGQLAPTARASLKTKSNPAGGIKSQFNPMAVGLGAGWTFVARAASVDSGTRKQAVEVIKQAILHKGSSLVIYDTECPTWNRQKTSEWIKERAVDVATLPGYNVGDINSALRFATIPEEESLPLGIYYQVRQPTLHEKLEISDPLFAGEPDVDGLENILNLFA